MDENKIYDEQVIDQRSWKEKLLRVKDDVQKFCQKHPSETVGIATTIGMGFIEIYKILSKRSNEKAIQKRIYDRSNGHRWELKRKPTNDQWCEIERRKLRGEKIGDILKDMRLI